MADPQISLDVIFKSIELISIMGGGGFMVFKFGRASQRFETVAMQQGMEISELKADIKELSRVMTKVALQDERLVNISARMNSFEDRLSDMAHGRGFIDVDIRRRLPAKDD